MVTSFCGFVFRGPLWAPCYSRSYPSYASTAAVVPVVPQNGIEATYHRGPSVLWYIQPAFDLLRPAGQWRRMLHVHNLRGPHRTLDVGRPGHTGIFRCHRDIRYLHLHRHEVSSPHKMI